MNSGPFKRLSQQEYERLKRSVTCDVKGCSAKALWYPSVRIWAKGYPKTSKPLVMETGLSFCEAHKHDFKLEDLGPSFPELLQKVAEQENLKEPDPASAKIEMLPIIG